MTRRWLAMESGDFGVTTAAAFHRLRCRLQGSVPMRSHQALAMRLQCDPALLYSWYNVSRRQEKQRNTENENENENVTMKSRINDAIGYPTDSQSRYARAI